ncbi:MAG: tandem-95 repeat protein, partial [Deltaproteobacteria bacterium]|nr:tandem-95 repeat protein [Deltaproteobacteria bacterium]
MSRPSLRILCSLVLSALVGLLPACGDNDAPLHGDAGRPPAPTGAPALTDTRVIATTGAAPSAPTTTAPAVRDVQAQAFANNQAFSVPEDNLATVTLSGTTNTASFLQFRITRLPARGTLAGIARDAALPVVVGGGQPQAPGLDVTTTLTYVPDADANGADSFAYETFEVDNNVDSADATVTITIEAVNDPPVVTPPAPRTTEDASVSFRIDVVDVDNAASQLTFTVGAPGFGTLSGTAPNLTYTPQNDAFGNDSFTVSVSDGTNTVGPFTIGVVVTAVNDAPTAPDQQLTTDEETAIFSPLQFADVDGDALTFTVVGAPTRGTLTGVAPNLTYTPAVDFNGTDSLVYRVSDGTLTSRTATVTWTVNAVNDAPVTAPGAFNTTEDTPLTLTLDGSDVDN